MKKSWKKQWMDELEERVPALKEDVLNVPIPIKKETKERQVETVEKTTKKKQRWSLTEKLVSWLEIFVAKMKSNHRILMRTLATTVAALLVCLVGVYAFLPNTQSSSVSVYALDINPRAVFMVNEEGIVTAVAAGNAEADVILASEYRKQAIEGKKIDVAIEKFVDYAARLGYLNLESGDIVRVAACNEKDNTFVIQKKLTNYFCNKGLYVAVLTEQLSVRDFSERVGENFTDKSKMVQVLENTPVLYGEREVEGKTVEELKTIYQKKVPQEEVKSTVEELLVNIMDWVTAREESLQAIADLNVMIKNHEDNPTVLFKDYWSVKTFHASSSFMDNILMQTMQTLIENHEKTYNVRITSEFDLKTLQIEASSEYLHTIAELLADFSMDVFNGNTEFLSFVMRTVGVDVDLATLCEEPQNKTEYLEKTKKYNQMRYRTMLTEASSSYAEERTPLTEADYNAYIQSVCAQYGSLEGYWRALNS